MALFYGGLIGFGAGTAGAAAGIFYGTRGVFGGGGYPASDKMDFITIASTGNADTFGDLDRTGLGMSGVGSGDAGRGVFWGASSGEMEYITISSEANSQDFGNLFSSYAFLNPGCGGDGNRGLQIGGDKSAGPAGDYYNETISYITIASTGDSLDFGDMRNGAGRASGAMDGTYCRFAGIYGSASPAYVVDIDSVTVATGGNATDWADLLAARYHSAVVSSDAGRGVWVGGYAAAPLVTMDYITIATQSNALDFGDHTSGTAAGGGAGVQNGPRGVINKGYFSGSHNEMSYITIASIGDATDFGDLTVARGRNGSCSGD